MSEFLGGNPSGDPGPTLAELSYTITADDYLNWAVVAVSRSNQSPFTKGMVGKYARLVLLLIGMPLLLTLWALYAISDEGVDPTTKRPLVYLVSILILYMLIVVKIAWVKGPNPKQQEANVRKFNLGRIKAGEIGIDVGPRTMQLSALGLTETSRIGRTFTQWRGGVCRIETTPDMLMIWISSHSAYFIPVKAFASTQAAEDFAALAQKLFTDAGGASDPDLARHLGEHSEHCPGCNYNLFACQRPFCPECGMLLRQSMFAASKDKKD